MKCEIFKSYEKNSLEGDVNWFLKQNKNIEIKHILQSESEGTVTITIFYEIAK